MIGKKRNAVVGSAGFGAAVGAVALTGVGTVPGVVVAALGFGAATLMDFLITIS